MVCSFPHKKNSYATVLIVSRFGNETIGVSFLVWERAARRSGMHVQLAAGACAGRLARLKPFVGTGIILSAVQRVALKDGYRSC